MSVKFEFSWERNLSPLAWLGIGTGIATLIGAYVYALVKDDEHMAPDSLHTRPRFGGFASSAVDELRAALDANNGAIGTADEALERAYQAYMTRPEETPEEARQRHQTMKRSWVTRVAKWYDDPDCVGVDAFPVPERRPEASLRACLVDDSIDPYADDDDDKYDDSEYQEHKRHHASIRGKCGDEIDALKKRFPEMSGVYVVVNSAARQGEGGGVAMYEKLLEYASRQGKAIAPHKCSEFGRTSESAQHVWDALKRRGYPHEGDVIWGKR